MLQTSVMATFSPKPHNPPALGVFVPSLGAGSGTDYQSSPEWSWRACIFVLYPLHGVAAALALGPVDNGSHYNGHTVGIADKELPYSATVAHRYPPCQTASSTPWGKSGGRFPPRHRDSDCLKSGHDS